MVFEKILVQYLLNCWLHSLFITIPSPVLLVIRFAAIKSCERDVLYNILVYNLKYTEDRGSVKLFSLLKREIVRETILPLKFICCAVQCITLVIIIVDT